MNFAAKLVEALVVALSQRGGMVKIVKIICRELLRLVPSNGCVKTTIDMQRT
jgi:hypothetical protein